ncbi:major tail protein [Gordonia phage ObLaDi]|uniref:Major tail protein n=3 Tax=Cafassovirus TaxID=3425056 RepID=A0A9E7TVE7_9CAUD|nr:major tail protein [Gordonia phage Cafasso]UVK59753.1 major tail protein [Gordonia phage Aleemily]UXE03736.1 major tail protein [Gordonia phage ObLaDi]
MAVSTVEAEAQLRNDLIRKPLRGFIAVADLDVEIPDAFTEGATAAFTALGEDWKRLGNISKSAGIGFSRETDAADIESWGASEPTRTDLTKDVTSAKFECQETRRATLELYYGVDLAAVQANAVTKELSFAQPTVLRTIYKRVIFVGVDGYGDDEIYVIKVMPRFSVTAVEDHNWSDDNAMTYGITGTAKVDPALGFSVKHHFAGPGMADKIAAMGFTVATP